MVWAFSLSSVVSGAAGSAHHGPQTDLLAEVEAGAPTAALHPEAALSSAGLWR